MLKGPLVNNRAVLTVFLAAAGAAGCSTDPVDVVTSQKGLTRIATLDATTHALLFAATDPFSPKTNDTAIDPTVAASTVAAAAPSQFQQPGCVVANANGATLSYTFTGCTSPLGVTDITGSCTVSYAVGSGPLTVRVACANLTVSEIPVTVDSSAVYAQEGAARTLTIKSAGSAPGDNYVIVQSTSDTTLAWNQGDTCATESALGNLTVLGVSFAQSASSITRCTGKCPADAVYTIASGTSTLSTVTYNGTATPPFTTASPSTGQIPLACPMQ